MERMSDIRCRGAARMERLSVISCRGAARMVRLPAWVRLAARLLVLLMVKNIDITSSAFVQTLRKCCFFDFSEAKITKNFVTAKKMTQIFIKM